MSFVASQAARHAAGPSTTTLALVGIGTFCIANPEKALHLVQRALLALSDSGNGGNHGVSSASPHPIVIHTGNSAAGGGSGGSGRGIYYAVVQLSLGAGLCWGSYVFLINVLPEQAKNMLPVTQGTFKTAVTSLGKGLLHVKDALSAEIASLFNMQSELAERQDETHEQVLYVQDQVADVHDDIACMQDSLDHCNRALATTDKRTTYIAKGIRLVTQGMTAMLPPDDDLVKELNSFQKASSASAEIIPPSPARRNKTEDSKPSRAATTMDSNGSHSGSRRSRRYERRGNKPPSTAGTPVQAVEIPPKAVADDKTLTSAGRELEELDEVRQLLESMERHSRLVL